MAKITFPRTLASARAGADGLLILAPASALAGGWHEKLLPKAQLALLDRTIREAEPGENGVVVSTQTGVARPGKIAVAVLPSLVSRHNSASRSESVFHCAAGARLDSKSKTTVLCSVENAEQVRPCANAVARALPLYSRKSGKKKASSVAFLAVDPKGKPIPASAAVVETVEASRWCAEMVDTPTADLTTADFVRRARALVRGVAGVKTSVIVGKELLARGLGGVHAVGRSATVGPRMLVMDYRPARKTRGQRTVALVGKGVVYDTGGLNLKIGGGMSGMKADMGGGGAVVGAFRVLAATKHKDRVICLVPLAENSIDKESYRPDDILTMHSGLTVEINNTDAEGRLLLADGVSYAGRKFSPSVVIDAATLTGAQLVATGYRHAAVVSNREGIEVRALAAGRATGDLAHPLPFAPEFFQQEFKSLIADMKNSVKDRANAQSSCAAQFVYRHIQDLDLPWIHIDLAGPSTRNGRGTGFGVALIAGLVETLQASDLK